MTLFNSTLSTFKYINNNQYCENHKKENSRCGQNNSYTCNVFLLYWIKRNDMEKKIINLNVIASLLLLLTVLAGCSRVNTSKDKSASLNTYRTYSWKEPDVKSDNPLYKVDLIDQSIRESLENELSQKGMVRDDENPDVYLKYHASAETKQSVAGSNYMVQQPYASYYSPVYGPIVTGPGYASYYGMGACNGNYIYSSGYYYPSTYSYTEEKLVLDFIDAKTDKVVWRGSVSNEVTNASDLNEQMEKGVHSIVKKFKHDQEDI
jgi:hypothetical protein